MRGFPDEKSIYSGAYSEALDKMPEKYPDDRFFNELAYTVGARESTDVILMENGYPVVAPDDFGGIFIRLVRAVYETMELPEFAERMYGLWGKLPDSIKNMEPFLTLSYADDPLSCGEEAQTRRVYENLFTYYEGRK